MSSTDLELINIKRQMEIQNAILERILDEFKRFNDNYEKTNESSYDPAIKEAMVKIMERKK